MKDLEQSKNLIECHDFSEVIERLVHIDGWKRHHAIEACKYYRRFLYLKLKYGSQHKIPPSVEMDDVWHAHILHTEDYVTFCQAVYGEYLHHHPHTQKGTLSTEQLAKEFNQETQVLYHQEFGEYIFNIRPTSWGDHLKELASTLLSSIQSWKLGIVTTKD